MVYTPNLDKVIKEYEHKKGENGLPLARAISVVIPNRNELPEKAVNTMIYSARANMLALTNYGIQDRIIERVCLSDQSDDNYARKTKERLEREVEEVGNEFNSAGCGNLLPEMSYFRIGNEMKDFILKDWNQVPGLSQLKRHINHKGELYGKGLNMYLSSMLIGVGEGDPNSAVLFLDADYRNRSAQQILGLSLPLSHMNYAAVTGTFNRYHKTEGGMERGGRVNAGTRALFDMLAVASLMNERGYPLCGDQGSTFDILKNLRWPMEFGIESAWRIQFHSYVNGFNREIPLLKNRSSLQVDIREVMMFRLEKENLRRKSLKV